MWCSVVRQQHAVVYIFLAGKDLLSIIFVGLLIRFVSFALQIYKMKYSNNSETNNIIPNKINSFNIMLIYIKHYLYHYIHIDINIHIFVT